jgi:hypothetical protein
MFMDNFSTSWRVCDYTSFYTACSIWGMGSQINMVSCVGHSTFGIFSLPLQDPTIQASKCCIFMDGGSLIILTSFNPEHGTKAQKYLPA